MPRRRLIFVSASALATSLAVVLLLALTLPPTAPPSARVLGARSVRLDASRTSATATTATLVAVGDIACPPGSTSTSTTCQQAATAHYAATLNPSAVLALGDLQYEKGSYYGFNHSYANSWGALKGITKPVVGNHEYYTSHADGYYAYFPAVARPGYYVFTLNGWRIYVLNSNCDRISCATENTWFDNQLTAHPSACSIMAMHHPRYSSGKEHGSSTVPRPFWRTAYRHHLDIALAGHDHDYERFKRLDGDGTYRTNGIVSFVVGTGGKSLYHLGTRRYGSQFFQATRFGVLKLTLGAGTWSWDYRGTGGRSLDSGTRSCV